MKCNLSNAPIQACSGNLVMVEQLIPTVEPAFAQRRKFRSESQCPQLWDILDNVFDPELPGLTIWDLGVLQDVVEHDEHLEVVITPTYSGCPAVETMSDDIVTALNDAGYSKVEVKVTLSPAWGTEMISPAGKAQLAKIKIAPPVESDQPDCPVCGSSNTFTISQFGSTACKALHQCRDCHETFDYFKRI